MAQLQTTAVTGSLTVTGQIVAQTLNVQQVTSSIIYSSGSNRFGNLTSDVQQFTGSLRVTGSGNHWIVGGSIGIGTAVPATPLHVFGGPAGTGGWNRTATLASTYPALIFNSNGSKWAGLAYDFSAAMRFWVNANNDDIFAGTQALSILNDGNIGIGISSPGVKLHVLNGTVTPTGGYSVIDLAVEGTGEAALGIIGTTYSSIYFGDAATALAGAIVYNHSNDALDFRTNGNVERMRITSAGSVGIGTSSPVQRLDVSGSIRVVSTGTYSDPSDNAGLINYDNASGVFTISARSSGGSTYIALRTSNAGTGAERVRITNDGNLGIGTTSPIGKLQIAGTSGNLLTVGTLTNNWAGEVAIGVTNGNGVIISKVNTSNDTNRVIILYRDDTNGATIWGYKPGGGSSDIGFQIRANASSYFNGGSVGIGTTTPNNLLTVNAGNLGLISNSYGNTGLIRMYGTDGNEKYQQGLTTGGDFYQYTFGGINHIFYTNTAESMRISTAGYLGIGTTSPSYKLDVYGTSPSTRVSVRGTTNYVLLQPENDSGTFYLGIDNNSGGGFSNTAYARTLYATGLYPMIFYTNSAERLRIAATGNIGIGTASPTARLQVSGSSDVLNIKGSGSLATSSLFSVDGAYGRLFEVSDDLSNSLFSVNTIAGLPVIEAFADYSVNLGTYSAASGSTMRVTGSRVGIGTTTPGTTLDVIGNIRAQSFTGSFSGSSAAPGANTNVIYNSSGVLAGSNSLVFNGTNLGIGTTNPTSQIHAVGGGGNGTAQFVGTSYTTHINYGTNEDTYIRAGKPAGNVLLADVGGNVGVGTSVTSYKLHVVGTSYISNTLIIDGGGNTLTLRKGTGAAALAFGGASDQASFLLEGVAGGGMQLYTSAGGTLGTPGWTSRLYVSSSGNVGIGTTTPARRLDVNGTSIFRDFTTVVASNGNSVSNITWLSTDSGIMNIYTGGTSTVQLNSSGVSYFNGGNLGIGTTVPGATLQIGHLNNTTSEMLRLGVQYGVSNTQRGTITWHDSSGITGKIWTIYDGSSMTKMNFGGLYNSAYDQGTYLTIQGNGNIGIGTTTPSTKLDIEGTNVLSALVSFNETSTTADRYSQLEFVAGSRTAYIWLANENSTSWAGAGGLNIYTTNGNMDFWTNTTQKIRITRSGSFLMGDVTTTPGESAWFGTGVFGKSGTNKVILGYLGSSTNGAVIGGHNSALNAWAPLNIDGSELRFNIQEIRAVTINASGNVGIGTTSPNALLNVNGANPYIRINNTSANDHGIKISYNNSDTHGLHLVYGANNATASIDNTYPVASGQVYGDMHFRQNVAGVITSRIMIKGDGGNVGIGTTAPAERLHVYSTNTQDGIRVDAQTYPELVYLRGGTIKSYISIAGSAGGYGTGTLADSLVIRAESGYIHLANSSAPVLTVNGSNVGIGTTTPTLARLQVQGNIWALSITGSLQGTASYATQALSASYAPGGASQWTTTGNNIYYTTGNVGIGTSTIGRKLDVYGDGTVARLQSPTANQFVELEFSASGVGSAYIFKNSSGYAPYGGGGSLNIYNTGNIGFHSDSTFSIMTLLGTGNVGIGSTAPAYKLDVNGTLRANSVIIGTDVTYGAPYKTVAFGNTGDGNNRILAATDSTDGMYFMAATGRGFNFRPNGGTTNLVNINSVGNLGVGTSNAGRKLQVVGSATIGEISNSSTNIALDLTAGGSGYNAVLDFGYWNTFDASIYAMGYYGSAGGAFKITDNGGGPSYDRMVMSGTTLTFPSSSIGIGTTSPTRKLSVYDSFAYMSFNSTSARTFTIGSDASGFIVYDDTAASYRAVINSNGNLGIGTTSPVSKLEISTGSGDNYIYTTNGTPGTFNGLMVRYNSINYMGAIGNPSSGEFRIGGFSLGGYFTTIYSNNAETVRVTAGNVGIGTTNPSTAKLVITTTAAAEGLDLSTADSYANLRVIRNSLSSIDKDMYIGYQSGASSKLHLYSNNVETVTVTGGTVGINTTTPRATLDVTGSGNAVVIGDGAQGGSLYFGANSNANSVLYAGGEFQIRTNQPSGLNFYTQGTQKRVIIADDGNVGIATTSAGYKLDVGGPTRIQGNTTNGVLLLNGGDASTSFGRATLAFAFNPTDGYYHWIHTRHNGGTSANNAIDFYTSDGTQNGTFPTNGVHALTMTAGSVGIGTTSPTSTLHVQGRTVISGSLNLSGSAVGLPEHMLIALSDETTNITTGTAKVTFRAPFAMKLIQTPRASLSTASTSGLVTVDINEAGTSIFTTRITIDANELTSVTAATPAVLSDFLIADDAQITMDIDTAGTGARGLKVTLYYIRV